MHMLFNAQIQYFNATKAKKIYIFQFLTFTNIQTEEKENSDTSKIDYNGQLWHKICAKFHPKLQLNVF